MSKNAHELPMGGSLCPNGATTSGAGHRGGRPVPERGTPVNMENRLHRDNGEGVVATPLPYPPRESKDERSCGCRMANELLILPLHLIQSVLGQKVEAKPMGRCHRERSQGRAAMRGREVACLPSLMGSPLSRSRRRETPSLSKSVLSAYFETGRAPAHAVSGALLAPVLQAVTSDTRNVHLTDEVPRCPGSSGTRVSEVYKSDTKGPPDAPATGTGSPRPRPWGWRQRRSRGPHCGDSERQNLRVSSGPLRSTGQVSPMSQATKWLGRTSSCQHIGSLRNGLLQPEGARGTVRQR